MNKSEAIILCIFVTILTMVMAEGAYLLGFTPLSFVYLINKYFDTGTAWGVILVAIDIFIVSLIFLLFVNAFYHLFNRISKYVIISGIIFLLVNFALSFLKDEYERMNLMSQLCLFSTITVSTTTFLYSIFYQNLIKCKS